MGSVQTDDKGEKNINRCLISAHELLAKNSPDIEMSKARDFSHYAFKYYTTMKTMSLIVCAGPGEKYLYASNLDQMNDRDEANEHSDKEKVHALCFCNTDTEGIPMWYMYSGILGEGGCIHFPTRKMMDFIKSISVVYPVGEDRKPMKDLPLTVGKDVLLKFGWIYYKDRGADLFYRNKWYRIKDDREDFFDDNYFVKEYPWHYEEEFRIVLINRTDTPYCQFAIPFPDGIIDQCRLILGPEIREHPLPKARVENSKLNIRMNLYLRNQEDISNFVAASVKQYLEHLESLNEK